VDVRPKWGRSAVLALAGLVLLEPPSLELALVGAGLVAFAACPESRLPPKTESEAWALVALLLLARATSRMPEEIAANAGIAAGVVWTAAAALALYLTATRAQAPRSSPGRKARLAAGALAAFVLLEGSVRLRGGGDRGSLELWTPTVGVAPSDAFAPGDAPRPDFRGRAFTPRKPTGVVRVLLLGGPSGERVAADLERELAPLLAPRRPEVLCFAHGGTSRLGVFLAESDRFAVDLFVALEDEDLESDSPAFARARAELERPIARELELRSRILARLVPTPPDVPTPRSAQRSAACVDALAILARARGARFAWVSQEDDALATSASAVRARGGFVVSLASGVPKAREIATGLSRVGALP
jgi:hypothetical protein